MTEPNGWPPPADESPPGARAPLGPGELPRYPGAGGFGEGGGWDEPLPVTPGVSAFGVPLAGWWQRVGAMLLDSILVGVIAFVLSLAFSSQGKHHGTSPALTVLLLLLSALYFSLFNGLGTGQTPGNRAPGIAIRDARTGGVIGPWRGVLRWLVRYVLYALFVVPGLVNDLFPLWDAQNQTLADKAAGSVVIRTR